MATIQIKSGSSDDQADVTSAKRLKVEATLTASSLTIGTVDQGIPNTLDNAWPVKPTDGITAITVKPGSTAAAIGDTAAVVALSPNSNTVQGTVASAATDSGNPIKTGGVINLSGSFFTNGQRADTQMDSAGSTYTDATGRLQSYSSFSSFTVAANATDIFTLTGSASKTIKIRAASISGTNTGNTNALFYVLKRSTADTGGTSTTLTAVARDSNNAAATATARSYTANPTTGTLVGNIRGKFIFLAALSSTNVGATAEADIGTNGMQPIVLRGTGEVFAINLNGTSITGTTVANISVDWTEE